MFLAGATQEGNRTVHGSSLPGPCLMRRTALGNAFVLGVVLYRRFRATARRELHNNFPIQRYDSLHSSCKLARLRHLIISRSYTHWSRLGHLSDWCNSYNC